VLLDPPAWELVVSGSLALAAASAGWWWGDRTPPVPASVRRTLGEWLRFERIARVLIVRPTVALARTLAAFDDRVLDRVVMTVPAAGLWLARLANRGAERQIDGGVRRVAAGARSLGTLARRPQTGLLHQYYAQAAIVLALLALLVVVVR
jgi:NADH-quinone oxidoreductase subunit L